METGYLTSDAICFATSQVIISSVVNATYDNLQPVKVKALDVRTKAPVAEPLRATKEDAATARAASGPALKTQNVNA